jgi:hypothetical protein
MNDLQMIRSMLDKPAPPEDVVHAGRDRLAAAAVAPHRSPSRRRTAWLTSGGLGLTAAAAAAAVAVAASGSPAPGRTPGVAAPPTIATLSARTVLLSAAYQTERQAAATGAHWHVRSRSLVLTRVGTEANPYTVSMGQQEEHWLAHDPVQGTSWQWQRDLGVQPATTADAAAWQRAGSPTALTMVNSTTKGKRLEMSLKPAEKATGGRYDPTNPGDKIYAIGPKNVSMSELLALPTDAGRLKKYLLSMYEGHGTESTSTPMSADVWLFTVSSGLVMGMPAKPAVRAAAYRMLAGLDSVKVIGSVKDPDGRVGTAVAIMDGSSQRRLIIDRETGRALAEESVVVKPTGFTEGFAPGTVFAYTVYQENGWTDAEPRLTFAP